MQGVVLKHVAAAHGGLVFAHCHGELTSDRLDAWNVLVFFEWVYFARGLVAHPVLRVVLRGLVGRALFRAAYFVLPRVKLEHVDLFCLFFLFVVEFPLKLILLVIKVFIIVLQVKLFDSIVLLPFSPAVIVSRGELCVVELDEPWLLVVAVKLDRRRLAFAFCARASPRRKAPSLGIRSSRAQGSVARRARRPAFAHWLELELHGLECLS